MKTKANKFLKRFTTGSKRGFTLGYFLLISCVILTVILPQIVKFIVDFVFARTPPLGVFGGLFDFLLDWDVQFVFLVLIGIYLLISLVKNIMYYIRKTVIYASSRKVFENLRTNILKKFANLDKVGNEGETFINLTYGGMHLIDVYNDILPDAAEYFLLAVFSLVFIFFLNFIVGLIVLISLPIFIIIAILYFRASRSVNEKVRAEEEVINMLSEQYIEGIKDIREIGYEDIAAENFAKQCDSEFDQRKEGSRYIIKYSLLLNLIRAAAYAAVLIFSGIFALNEFMSVGDFVAISSYAFTVFGSVSMAIGTVFKIQESLVSIDRIMTFLESKTQTDEFKSKEFITAEPNLSVQKLGYKVGSEEVLKGISFEIPYGTSVGITGMQGSGKSLLGNLLLRLAKPSRGGIFINKVDVKEININSLRGQFSYQPQVPYIFNDTIKSNIVLFEKDVDEVRLNKVLKVVRLNKFIGRQPHKLNTILLGDGIGVPKQEKQKINIARALYRGTPILLLDSPIRYFDAEESAAILKNIFLYYYGKTIILLTSNPEELMLCDNIMFLKGGKIVEEGSPEQLLELGGYFAKAYNKQKEWSGIG